MPKIVLICEGSLISYEDLKRCMILRLSFRWWSQSAILNSLMRHATLFLTSLF